MGDSLDNSATRDDLLQEALAGCLELIEGGDVEEAQAFAARHPDFAAELSEFLADWRHFRTAATGVCAGANGSAEPHRGPFPRRMGDYELLEAIAQGGMGIVYKALHVPLRRIVAVKMLRAGLWATPAEVQRFQSEAAAAAQLDHPGIVPIYEVGQHEGHPYFSMAYVAGESLAQRVASGPLEPAAAARFVREIALALQFAHDRGVVHRDLKPANILLDQNEPRITDFGLALWLSQENGLTRTGELVGTPSYMAPEQTMSEGGSLGPQTDVYSLGAVLYCLLVGRPPFQSAHPLDTLRLVRETEPVAPSDLNPLVPRDLDTIALHCLEKQPGRRYATAQEAADELSRFLEGRPIRTRPVSPAERTARWARRQPLVAALLGLVAVSLLGGMALSTYFGTLAHRRATEEESRSEELEYALYRSRIVQADLEWQNDNVARADDLLDACPERFRNWEWGYLKRKCHAERLACDGHAGAVRRVRYSPDGKQLLSAGQDQSVRLWDARSGQPLARRDFPAAVMSVSFLPDDAAAVALSDGSVIVWDLDTGGWRFFVRHARAEILDLAVDSEGRWLAAADAEGSICIISTQDGSVAATLPKNDNPVNAVAFDESGRLASAGDDELIRLWDWQRGAVTATCAGHTGSTRALAFVPGGERLISAGDDATLRLWNTATGELLDTWEVHTAPVWSVAVSPDGRLVASAGESGSVVLQETATGDRLRTWKGHHLLVYGTAFHPEGREIASSGMDGHIQVWDIDSEPYVPKSSGHEGRVNEIALSDDGRQIASASKDGTVRIWDSARVELLETFTTGVSNLSIAFGPGGRWLVAGAEDGTVRILRRGSPERVDLLKGHRGPVWSVAVDRTGLRLASAGQDGTVRLWDVARLGEEQALAAHSGAARCVRFSADGGQLASCGDDGAVRIWYAAQGQELRRLASGSGKLWNVAFSREGDRLAASGSDGTARVWNVATGEQLSSCGPHSGTAYSVAFSPDGTRLITGSFDQTLKIWDAAGGAEMLTLRGHIWSVNSVAVAPDGMTIASGSSDYRVRLWHARAWR